MDDISPELNDLRSAYKAAVEEWIAAIRDEEALVSANHNVAEIDRWEAAFFRQDEIRGRVIAAKTAYEDALRKVHFDF